MRQITVRCFVNLFLFFQVVFLHFVTTFSRSKVYISTKSSHNQSFQVWVKVVASLLDFLSRFDRFDSVLFVRRTVAVWLVHWKLWCCGITSVSVGVQYMLNQNHVKYYYKKTEVIIRNRKSKTKNGLIWYEIHHPFQTSLTTIHSFCHACLVFVISLCAILSTSFIPHATTWTYLI